MKSFIKKNKFLCLALLSIGMCSNVMIFSMVPKAPERPDGRFDEMKHAISKIVARREARVAKIEEEKAQAAKIEKEKILVAKIEKENADYLDKVRGRIKNKIVALMNEEDWSKRKVVNIEGVQVYAQICQMYETKSDRGYAIFIPIETDLPLMYDDFFCSTTDRQVYTNRKVFPDAPYFRALAVHSLCSQERDLHPCGALFPNSVPPCGRQLLENKKYQKFAQDIFNSANEELQRSATR